MKHGRGVRFGVLGLEAILGRYCFVDSLSGVQLSHDRRRLKRRVVGKGTLVSWKSVHASLSALNMARSASSLASTTALLAATMKQGHGVVMLPRNLHS